MKKAILLATILLISLSAGCLLNSVQATTTITKIQSARGTGTGTSITVNLPATPTEGDALIAVVGFKYSGAAVSVSDIVQTGVDWQFIQTSQANNKAIVIIWAGVVGSGASSSMTIQLTGAVTAAVADVGEYSGLNTEYILANGCDQSTNGKGTTTPTNTGTTSTTRYTNELWVAGTVLTNSLTQTSSTNSFTLTDGAVSGTISVGYLETIVSSTGDATTGTNFVGTGSNPWTAVIVTFPAASSMTLTPSHGVKGSGTTIQCNGNGLATDTTINAKWDGADITFTGDHTSDHGGSFLVTITLPPTAAAGDHSVIVQDDATSAHATFAVSDPVSVLPESDLGISSLLIAVALAMVVWAGVAKRAKKE
jgi:hypothetical protein